MIGDGTKLDRSLNTDFGGTGGGGVDLKSCVTVVSH